MASSPATQAASGSTTPSPPGVDKPRQSEDETQHASPADGGSSNTEPDKPWKSQTKLNVKDQGDDLPLGTKASSCWNRMSCKHQIS